MSLRLLVGLLVLAMLVLTACSEDKVIPPNDDSSIVGNYTGIYQYTEIQNGVDTVIDTTQLIELTFRQQEYSMSIDTSIPDSLRVFCDVTGTYELGNGINMSIADSNYTRGVCPAHWGLGGFFSLSQTTDTLRMLNDMTDSLGVRRLRYLRIVNTD